MSGRAASLIERLNESPSVYKCEVLAGMDKADQEDLLEVVEAKVRGDIASSWRAMRAILHEELGYAGSVGTLQNIGVAIAEGQKVVAYGESVPAGES